jgi:putative spermidine/putrescine transport system substrate-binding protein
MGDRFTRRDALKLASAGALASQFAPGLIERAMAADPIKAVTWGGGYADALTEITKKYATYPVDWSLYQNASGEVVAKTKAAWPNAPYDISENWDADYIQLYNEGWLETMGVEEIPNLAHVPKAVYQRFTDPAGKAYAVPISLGAMYWGYRKDLVSFPITEIQQLLDPRLKGMICLPSITKGTGVILVVLAVANGGSEHNVEPGWDFLKKLVKSGNVGRVAESEVDFSNSINSGETAITFWNPVLWTAVKKNWECVILSKAKSKTLKSYFYTDGFVIYKGPRAKEAMDFLNFLLSPEANNMYNKDLGQAPAISNGKIPAAAADMSMTDEEYKKYAYFCDYSVMSQQHDGWVKRWEKEIQPLLRT